MFTSSSDSEFFFAGRFNIRVTTLFFLLINSGSSCTSTSLNKIETMTIEGQIFAEVGIQKSEVGHKSHDRQNTEVRI